jgi:phage-related tail protein
VNTFHRPKAFFRNLVFCGCALLAVPVFATPADEITRAVKANGGSNVSQASPQQFVKAFTALAARVQPRDLPGYVSAAVNLRPDLAPNVVAVAIKAAAKSLETKPQLLCAVIQKIVAAAIAADPSAAAAIAEAAAAAAPAFRSYIISAAIAAAPQAKDQILEAAMTKTVPLAFLTFLSSDFGTNLNPANISEVGGNGAVNSPEQPLSH